MDEKNEERIDRLVEDLLRGRRLQLGVEDASEAAAIMAAATLAASRQGHPRMSSGLRRRLMAMVAGEPTSSLLDRRAALAAVAGLAVGAAGALGLGRLGGSTGQAGSAPGTSDPGRPAGILRPAAAMSWVPVGALVDFPEGKATPIVAGTVRAFVFRKGEILSAVSSICSDLPCSLDWREGEGDLFCPCHRQKFGVDGAPQQSERDYSVPPLPTFKIRVEAGRVLVLVL